MKILLVEDDIDLAVTTQNILERQNYVVDVAPSLQMAKAAVLEYEYSIILLDRRLPDGEGTELIRFVRKKNIQTRFLVLSAMGDLVERVEGLDLGADDYMVKPVEPDELLARIRAAERRPIPELVNIQKIGRLQLDLGTRNVSIDGEALALPRREMTILQSLLGSAGRVVMRDTLENAMYGYDEEIRSNVLESHMSRLRKKLVTHNAGVSIHTIRGVGYMLKVDT